MPSAFTRHGSPASVQEAATERPRRDGRRSRGSPRRRPRQASGIRDVGVERDRPRTEPGEQMTSDEALGSRHRDRAGHGATLPAGYRLQMSVLRPALVLACGHAAPARRLAWAGRRRDPVAPAHPAFTPLRRGRPAGGWPSGHLDEPAASTSTAAVHGRRRSPKRGGYVPVLVGETTPHSRVNGASRQQDAAFAATTCTSSTRAANPGVIKVDTERSRNPPRQLSGNVSRRHHVRPGRSIRLAAARSPRAMAGELTLYAIDCRGTAGDPARARPPGGGRHRGRAARIRRRSRAGFVAADEFSGNVYAFDERGGHDDRGELRDFPSEATSASSPSDSCRRDSVGNCARVHGRPAMHRARRRKEQTACSRSRARRSSGQGSARETSWLRPSPGARTIRVRCRLRCTVARDRSRPSCNPRRGPHRVRTAEPLLGHSQGYRGPPLRVQPEPLHANRDVRIVGAGRRGDPAAAVQLDHVASGIGRLRRERLHELEPAGLDDLGAEERRREDPDRPGDLAAQLPAPRAG